jgi:zinc and cadmium transporter
MSPTFSICFYSACVLAASIAGGWLPSAVRLTHTRLQVLISFVGGLMLGVGVFHMLPHAAAQVGSLDRVVWWMMVGLLSTFFLVRAVHFHQHSTAEVPEPSGGHEPGLPDANPGGDIPPQAGVDQCDHAHHHPHDHTAAHSHSHAPPVHQLSWIGVTFGLTLHTLTDGIALAAGVHAEAAEANGALFVGLGTFLAILLHKPLDAVSITTLMAAGGWSASWRNAVNVTFALICPLAALAFYFNVHRFGVNQHVLVGCALGFAAGVFLCISLGDLLPEVEFHAHDRLKLSAALLAGIALAYSIGFLESEHAHFHAPDAELHNHEN